MLFSFPLWEEAGARPRYCSAKCVLGFAMQRDDFSLAFKILPLAVTFFREFSFCGEHGVLLDRQLTPPLPNSDLHPSGTE